MTFEAPSWTTHPTNQSASPRNGDDERGRPYSVGSGAQRLKSNALESPLDVWSNERPNDVKLDFKDTAPPGEGVSPWRGNEWRPYNGVSPAQNFILF